MLVVDQKFVFIPAVFWLCLWVGCSRKPTSKTRDFSNSNAVTIILGEPQKEYGDGLQHIHFEEDGLTTPTMLGNIVCRHLKLEGTNVGYVYFMIDGSFKRRKNNVDIVVEYFDQQPGKMGLHYDATGLQKVREPAYAELGQNVDLWGWGEWRTATFHVSDAAFRNSQNSRSDFRLWVKPPDLYIRRVTVIRSVN